MRLKIPEVKIGMVSIGGGNPIVIQSMTNTDTEDVKATVQQCVELAKAGSEMVRITVNTEKAAQQVPRIRNTLNKNGYEHVPLIGDFHFNGHTLLTHYPECAEALDKYRINPGNVGYGEKHEYNFATMIEIALKYRKPVRIGVNWGSLDRELLTELMNKNAKQRKPKADKEVLIEAMVESALRCAQYAEKIGLPQNRIVLSVKMSVVPDVVKAYELLAEKMKKHPYALHLGLTEAGAGMKGAIASSAALAILLEKGIGDTIRISLTPSPKSPRTEEVEACKWFLQALGLHHFKPEVTSCPGCGRSANDFFQKLAEEVNEYITKKISTWNAKYKGVEHMKVAVMGCVVNGPGESMYADIGISLPGKGEAVAQVYKKGKYFCTLRGKNIAQEFIDLVEKYVQENYGTLQQTRSTKF